MGVSEFRVSHFIREQKYQKLQNDSLPQPTLCLFLSLIYRWYFAFYCLLLHSLNYKFSDGFITMNHLEIDPNNLIYEFIFFQIFSWKYGTCKNSEKVKQK